jgi:nucleotide-binding universal stress UspA family protein
MSLLRRLMVATDFSGSGHAAVARAGQLAAQHHCLLTVCHATPDWPLFSQRADVSQEHYAHITRHADELMRREIAWLQSEYGLTNVRAQVLRGSASMALHHAIESVQPDLLVVGACGESQVPGEEAIPGGTALKLMSRVSGALLLVRNGNVLPYRRTLAAVTADLEMARRLMQWAQVLAGTDDCHVVRTYDAPFEFRLRLCGLSDAQIDAATESQRRLAQEECSELEKFAPPGASCTVHVVRGAPVAAVLAEVAAKSPGLLIVGQHRHRDDDLPGAWAAEVGTRLAYHCPTDVLIVR